MPVGLASRHPSLPTVETVVQCKQACLTHSSPQIGRSNSIRVDDNHVVCDTYILCVARLLNDIYVIDTGLQLQIQLIFAVGPLLYLTIDNLATSNTLRLAQNKGKSILHAIIIQNTT